MFLNNMMTAAQQVLILYIIVAVGFVADRLHVFTQDTAKLCNNLLFYIVTPVVIIRSFMTMECDKATAGKFFICFVIMCVTIFVGILLAIPFFNKCGNAGAVYKYASSYGNMGYMALPLANAILGAEGVFFCATGSIAFNIIAFTHGIWLMNKDREGKTEFDLKRLILNPGVISVLIGLPFFIFKIDVPEVIDSSLQHIGNMNTPLAMLFLGTYIANTDLKTMFKDKYSYLVLLIKLAVTPLCMLGVLKLLGVSGTILTVCIICASVPCATNTVMFSAKYDKDTGLASKVVALCSLFSVVTMPIMIALSKI